MDTSPRRPFQGFFVDTSSTSCHSEQSEESIPVVCIMRSFAALRMTRGGMVCLPVLSRTTERPRSGVFRASFPTQDDTGGICMPLVADTTPLPGVL